MSQEVEKPGKPWGLILISLFFILSLVGPVIFEMIKK